MADSENQEEDYFLMIKIVQTGKIISVPLNDLNLDKKFKEIYDPLLKRLKLKSSYSYLSDPSGRMLSQSEMTLTVKEIVEKFGTDINLYYEKVM